MVKEINKNINVIEKKFNNMYNTNYELIATGIKNWDLQMEQFKNNISKNISYNYIEKIIKYIRNRKNGLLEEGRTEK